MKQIFNAFSVPQKPEEVNEQFASAVTIYRERWHCEPTAVYVHKSTPTPNDKGNIEVVEDNYVPRRLWYFEVEEVMTAD